MGDGRYVRLSRTYERCSSDHALHRLPCCLTHKIAPWQRQVVVGQIMQRRGGTACAVQQDPPLRPFPAPQLLLSATKRDSAWYPRSRRRDTHAPASTSFLSCPGVHPQYPTKRRSDAACVSFTASKLLTCHNPGTTSVVTPGIYILLSATRQRAFRSVPMGPPMPTLQANSTAFCSQSSSGTMTDSGRLVWRFKIIPIEPFSSSWVQY